MKKRELEQILRDAHLLPPTRAAVERAAGVIVDAMATGRLESHLTDDQLVITGIRADEAAS